VPAAARAAAAVLGWPRPGSARGAEPGGRPGRSRASAAARWTRAPALLGPHLRRGRPRAETGDRFALTCRGTFWWRPRIFGPDLPVCLVDRRAV